MNIFLLGNGFDLHHCFPTRYDSFLHTVDFLQQYYDNKSMSTIGDIFGDNRLLEKDNFISLCYKKYKDAYSEIELDKKSIERIIELAKDNMWFKYFLSSYNKESGWIDFEKVIARVVDVFEKFFIENKDVSHFELPTEKSNSYILTCFDFFFSSKPVERIGLGIIPGHNYVLDDFLIEDPIGSENMILDKEKIISKLYKELIEIAEMLKLYLIAFVDNSVDTIKVKGLVEYNSVFDNMNTIISFNYTDTAIKLYSCKNINYIHGTTKDKIVLGINPDANDEENGQNYVDTSFLQFKKYFQRVFYRTDLKYIKFLRTYKDMPIDNFEINLYVAGHSLDITDEDIIKEVFEMSDKIVVVCYSDKAISDSINNLVKIYGKKEFDELRYRTDLEFKLYTDFNTR